MVDEYSKEGVEANKAKEEEEIKEMFGDHYTDLKEENKVMEDNLRDFLQPLSGEEHQRQLDYGHKQEKY